MGVEEAAAIVAGLMSAKASTAEVNLGSAEQPLCAKPGLLKVVSRITLSLYSDCLEFFPKVTFPVRAGEKLNGSLLNTVGSRSVKLGHKIRILF